MKKKNINIALMSSLLLILGLLIGTFFGSYRGLLATEIVTKNLMISAANTPASPVVVKSYYNEEKGELSLALVNTGVMPIKILNKSLFITPKGQENISVALDIPMNTVINSGQILIVKTELKADKENFKLGDKLTSSFDYIYPISNDIYSLTHIFTKSDKTDKNNNIVNSNGNNSDLQKKYRKQTEKDYKNQK